jgi:hypothetical protein
MTVDASSKHHKFFNDFCVESSSNNITNFPNSSYSANMFYPEENFIVENYFLKWQASEINKSLFQFTMKFNFQVFDCRDVIKIKLQM